MRNVLFGSPIGVLLRFSDVALLRFLEGYQECLVKSILDRCLYECNLASLWCDCDSLGAEFDLFDIVKMITLKSARVGNCSCLNIKNKKGVHHGEFIEKRSD